MDNPLFGPRDGYAGDLLGDVPRIGYPQTGPQVSSADVKVDPKKTRQIKGWTIEIGEATEEEVAKERFNKTWSEYKGSAKYVEPNSQGYAVVEVLNFLKGRRLDNIALNYIHSVRPSRIRIVPMNGGITCDAITWRVTVYTAKPNSLEIDNETPLIKRIEQEVQVGCVGYKHAHDLHCALKESQ